MDYQLTVNVKDNHKVRAGFIELAVKTFGLSFEKWYQDGYWTEKYIPYSLLDGDRVAANVSVNIMDTVWQGQDRRYIQLGTVMTDLSYRQKGLSSSLIQTVLGEWRSKCHAVYLFANETVLDFYPKFGFQQALEYQCSIPVAGSGRSGKVRKLNMETDSDRRLLKTYYEKSNPFSALPMINNYGLLMFYCSAYLKECIYYWEEFDAVMVAAEDGGNFVCYDIYCDTGVEMQDILAAAAGGGCGNILLGFPPKDASVGKLSEVSGEDTLFILSGKENLFQQNRLMFPVLSHA